MIYAVDYTQRVCGHTHKLTMLYLGKKHARSCRTIRTATNTGHSTDVVAGQPRRAKLVEVFDHGFDPIRIPRI